MSVSTLIMTWNEEANLPSCLASLKWCDDIVLLDSFSTDQTVEIAKAAGARVYQRAWDSESCQRMHGLRQIPFKHEWVYMPDADEITTAELQRELLLVSRDSHRSECAFRVRRKDIFMGKWIKHSTLYPTFFTRLVRPDRVEVRREIHPYYVVDGDVGDLVGHIEHHSFRKGVSDWFKKHNWYSNVEANLAISTDDVKSRSYLDVFSSSQRERRDAIKKIVMKLPFRPTLRFLYMYLVRRGFLDGWAGYSYCRMIAAYELMIVVKTEELRRRARGLSI